MYEFTAADIERVEAAARELHRLCLLAVEHVIQKGLLARVGVRLPYHKLVSKSWQRRDPALLARFDLAYDGQGEPKMLEYNADTPTSLLESAVVQWHWLEETRRADWDQFNLAHELIIARWREILPEDAFVHFICQRESVEDLAHVRYLLDTLMQAGRAGTIIDISDVGIAAPGEALFRDRFERPIAYAFKLYPWDWMFEDRFGYELVSSGTNFIEPAWRAVLNSKALLPILWELFPNHPNLLPAYWSPRAIDGPYVSKPLHGREGANIEIVHADGRAVSYGPYGGPKVYQAFAPLFNSDGRYAVVGAWMVGDIPAGISMREDASRIVGGDSQFVPHAYR